jgi:chitin deacetylase
MPQAWVNALNYAVAAGKIPNVPMSNIATPGTNPVYPNGLSPASPQVCSGTYGCRITGDIWDAPDGVFASAFDDGPTPVSLFHFFFGLILVLVTVIQFSLPPPLCNFCSQIMR